MKFHWRRGNIYGLFQLLSMPEKCNYNASFQMQQTIRICSLTVYKTYSKTFMKSNANLTFYKRYFIKYLFYKSVIIYSAQHIAEEIPERTFPAVKIK